MLPGDTAKGTAVTTSAIIVNDGTELVTLGPLAGSTGALGRMGLNIISPDVSMPFIGAKGLSLVDKWEDSRISFAVTPERS